MKSNNLSINSFKFYEMLKVSDGKKESMEKIIAEQVHGLTVEGYRKKFTVIEIDEEIRYCKTLVQGAGDFAAKEKKYINTDVHGGGYDYEGKLSTLYQIATPKTHDDNITQCTKKFRKGQKGLELCINCMGDLLETRCLPPSTVDFINEFKRSSEKLLALKPFDKEPFLPLSG